MTPALHEVNRPIVRVFQTAEMASNAVADLIEQRMLARPAITLGLATGATPRLVYRKLVERAGAPSWRHLRCFNLDEYVGLAAHHPASFAHYMRELLFDHVDIATARTHIPDGMAPDLDAAAETYEQLIAESGGIDLQLLGIGRNGHIGFNEPGSSHDSRTREVQLALSTIDANRPDFPEGEEPPATALTMGIGTILDAREIVLLATGSAKAEALAAMLEGPISLDCPASALQRHGAVTVFCDKAAAANLNFEQLDMRGSAHAAA
ncbi:glucosamine-6-phosphate deaminase [Rhizobium sp. NFR07]|uniref:glucosamine-6-phosphate deaminase n=1 Tax=Rhizobium sp. NFR07 TaxID=1566262 RepID=UPI0008F00E4B|nr:glucosamine-6-phosphate deaminase [Rhizobium sp. NFR07]SFA76723.1 glucosamine-6-phosphate deaminase [Rhizobium sp. NFR07]